MLERIKKLLTGCGITEYLLCEEVLEANECYLFGHQEDMVRKKKLRRCKVTVYHTTNHSRSEAKATLFPDMTEREMTSILHTALENAKSLNNPYYDFPSPCTSTAESTTASTDAVHQLANAAMSADPEGQLLYLELFDENVQEHLVSSWGTDVWNCRRSYSGELAAGCDAPRSVEVYQAFSMDQPDEAAMAALVTHAKQLARLRAQTTASTKTGTYNVIFTDQFVHELLKMYLVRSNAEQICAKRSDYEIGQPVSSGAALPNFYLEPSTPYSEEGIPMQRQLLLEDGILRTIHGSTQFCRRLNVPPCGTFNGLFLECGTRTLLEMQAEPYFMPLLFSDFIMYGSSGDFFGEIRLGYYYDGKKLETVSGGSISGNLGQLESTMEFSKERYQEKDYNGPKALRLAGVQITGQEG